jgi:hypothetical protein
MIYSGTRTIAMYFSKYSELVDKHFIFDINASLKSLAIAGIASASFNR